MKNRDRKRACFEGHSGLFLLSDEIPYKNHLHHEEIMHKHRHLNNGRILERIGLAPQIRVSSGNDALEAVLKRLKSELSK